MTTIDQRILIPTGPEAVWELVSSIASNPSWQVDCKSISFLSSRRDGPGVRWRYTSHSGRDYVLETTAWYDGLGYEYTFVDGVGYRESKGRIRLQEIPEGTIVQWTFTYEIPGVIGGLRNSLGVRRNLENTMIESLKTLWRIAKENRDAPREVHEAKSLMRDALDYEQRAQYKSRHGSSLSQDADDDEHGRFRPAPPAPPTQVRQEPVAARPVIIPEPPVADDDTKPSPAVSTPAPPEVEQARPAVTPEPEFLARMPESETDDSTALLPTTPDKDPTKERDDEELRRRRVEMPTVPVNIEPVPDTLQPESIAPELPPEREAEAPPKPADAAPSPPPIRIDETDDHAVFRPPPIPVFDEESTAHLLETATEESVTSEISVDSIDPVEAVEETEAVPVAEPEITPEPVDAVVIPTEAEAATSPAIHEPEAVAADQPPADEDKRSTRESAAVDTSKLDTTEVSIWEIFGVPRPSETQEIAAVKIEAALESQMQSIEQAEAPAVEEPPVQVTAPPVTEAISSDPHPSTEQVYPHYTGLRIRLRRSLVHLRRHQD